MQLHASVKRRVDEGTGLLCHRLKSGLGGSLKECLAATRRLSELGLRFELGYSS